jgi:predicted metal-dependent hydrolase
MENAPISQPVIALTGFDANLPAWLEKITRHLTGYDLRPYADRSRLDSALADDLVALILVDGDSGDWRFWTATPKSSPATRRIPLFLITDNATIRQQALISGADLTLTPAEIVADIQRLVKDFARVPDPVRVEQLDCECQEDLPPLAQQGFEKFNAGEFYKQHDLFEELWVQTEGPVRDLYRAILQVGVAYYQILRGNHRGARKMLLRSVQWLAILPDACQGIDVKALREDSYRVRAELERLPEDQIDQFDKSLLKPVKKLGA